jgi:hypothetical protein
MMGVNGYSGKKILDLKGPPGKFESKGYDR